MRAGVQNAVVPPQQFRTGVSADLAEIIVGIGDAAGQIGHRNDDGLIDRILLFDQFLPDRFGAVFRQPGIGDVPKNLDQSAIEHAMAADGDDISVPELVGGIEYRPGTAVSEATGDIFRRIRRAAGSGRTAVENIEQRRPRLGLRRRQPIHGGEVTIADYHPQVGVEDAQAVRGTFDRRGQQHLRPRVRRCRARAPQPLPGVDTACEQDRDDSRNGVEPGHSGRQLERNRGRAGDGQHHGTLQADAGDMPHSRWLIRLLHPKFFLMKLMRSTFSSLQ
ncbi:MAG: hypothetical protein Q8M18_05100 [Bradyrhizobium sp.]|nr:hypothetical protein [Bradyrhizobium sp.]